MTQVTVKFVSDVDLTKAAADLGKAPGVLSVEQVFPHRYDDGKDSNLDRIHVVEVDDANLAFFLSYCAISFDIEYAEKCAPRRTGV